MTTGPSDDELLRLTADIVGINTENPPGGEAALASYLADRLGQSPVEFQIDRYDVLPDRPNLVARAGDPSRGTLLLTGHMDVVPAQSTGWTGDPFELREADGRLVGRGVSDMKGALAAMLVAAERYLATATSPGEVVLAFVVNEERGGEGTEALVDSGLVADGAILGEPTGLRPALAQYGSARYRIHVHGRSAHSGRPDRGVNAINGACRVVERLERLEERFCRRDHPLLEPGGSISVTEFASGTAPNVIPNAADLTVKWRVVPGVSDDPSYYHRHLEEALAGIEVRGSPVSIEYDLRSFSTGIEVAPDERVVRAISQAAEDLQFDSDPVGFNAGSDMRYLVPAGIPTVLLGPGSVEDDAHTVDESIAVGALLDAARLYHRSIERFFDDNDSA